jgi:hypothetical protein
VSGWNATVKISDNSEKRTLSHEGATSTSSKYLQIGGDEPVYFGGVPNSIKERISSELGHVKNASSLRGCLSHVYINARLRNLAHADYSHKTLPGCHFKNPCRRRHHVNNDDDDEKVVGNDLKRAVVEGEKDEEDRCLNGGKCVNRMRVGADFVCECRPDFTGTQCETPLRLGGDSLQYRALALPLVNSNIK